MWWISVDCKSTASGYLRFDSFLPHFNRNLCPWLMESDVGRDTNKSLWVLGRYGYIAEDWKSLEQSSILWTPTVVLAYLTKVCEHLKRTNKAMSSRLYVAT